MSQTLSKKLFLPGWFPILLGSDLVTGGKPKGAIVQSTPLVLRRVKSGAVKAYYDVCPHRGVPLSEGFVENDKLRCPYHGWAFNAGGDCVDIPGLVDQTEITKATKPICLTPVLVEERNGVVWVNLEADSKTKLPIEADNKKRYFFKGQFSVGLEDLIENFSDPVHTRFVHTGIIRKNEVAPSPRKVKYTVNQTQMLIEHEDKFDEIGPLLLLANPKRAPLRHKELIIFPNYLTLTYEFLGTKKFFQAELLLSPESATKTNLIVAINYNFPFLNWIAWLAIHTFANRVIKQDEKIMSLLGRNKSLLESMNHSVTHYTSIPSERHYDELRKRIMKLRRGELDENNASGEFEISL